MGNVFGKRKAAQEEPAPTLTEEVEPVTEEVKPVTEEVEPVGITPVTEQVEVSGYELYHIICAHDHVDQRSLLLTIFVFRKATRKQRKQLKRQKKRHQRA